MLTEAGEGDFYADVDPRIPTQQTDPKAHLLKMDPEAVILSGARASRVERILQPSPFVRWLWAEHRGFFMAFVCAVAPPIVALGGLLLTFLIRGFEPMFLRIWRAHWVSSRQQAARVPFAIAHWHAALVLACASTVMCVQVLPRLLLRTAPAEDVDAGGEGAQGRLGAPQLASAAAPDSAPATEGGLAAAATAATSKEAVQPSNSNRIPWPPAQLIPFGQSAPNTIGRLPFRQGWADFGRVTTAVLVDEPPSASMYMHPQPLNHMPLHLAGPRGLQLPPGRWAWSHTIIRHILVQEDWRSLCVALGLCTTAFIWILVLVKLGWQPDFRGLYWELRRMPASFSLAASQQLVLVALWMYFAVNAEWGPPRRRRRQGTTSGGIVDVARPVVPQRPLGEDVFGHLRAIRTAPYREDVWALLGALCCWPCSDPASGQDPCHASGGEPAPDAHAAMVAV